jgi:hypothetical protein
MADAKKTASPALEINGVQFSNSEAWALAELCKRIGYSECRANAVSDDEARDMIVGTSKMQQALARAGFTVR